jgi:uncharacterized repeat protein (TIGR01451 family)
MKTGLAKILTYILALALLAPLVPVGASPFPPQIKVLDEVPEIMAAFGNPPLDLDAALRSSDGKLHLIVELQLPPLGLAAHNQNLPFDLARPKNTAYRSALVAQQDAVLEKLSPLAPSLEVDFRYQAAFNGFGIRIRADEVELLFQLDEINQVYPDRPRRLMLDASTELIHAPAFWQDLGGQEQAGAGVRIAVIDTGVRSEHPMFDGDGFTQPPGFPYGYCEEHPDDPSFQCNPKLIAARYYAPAFPVHGAEVNSPLDIHGHGSHVAGIAAGNPVDVPSGEVVPAMTSISGVAPQAYLLVYKTFFAKPDGTAGSSDSRLLAALDDALLDGAQVVNNSWGGLDIEDPENNPFRTAVQALNAVGAVVVFAAGDGGPTPGTISCPGCLEEVITVGATTADRIFANPLDVTGPGAVPDNLLGLAALSGSGPELVADLEADILYSGDADPLNLNACAAFSGQVFSNTIALMPRGDCSFQEKVTHAQDAGAIGALIYNNEPGFPLLMANLETTLIPSFFMAQDQGQVLLDWVANMVSSTVHISATVSALHNPNWQDLLWEKSGVGPNIDPGIFKPDLVAPGVNILSAISPVFTGGEANYFLQGSSMAAAHVSGAAALMRQLHPDWSPQQIKTALKSTAAPQVLQPDGLTSATPFMMGSGRLDLGSVRQTNVTFSHGSFVESHCSLQCGWDDALITNAGQDVTPAWRVANITAPTGMQISVTPVNAVLYAGESLPFSVTVDVSELPPDQWYFSKITWVDKFNLLPDAVLPVAVYVTDPIQARFTKDVDQVYASPDDTLAYSLTLTNEFPLTTTFSITDPIPQNAGYVPGSAAGGLSYDSGEDQLVGAVALSGAQLEIITDTLYSAYYSLPDLGVDPVACPDTNCDDAALVISGLDFYYNGRSVAEVVWSTNGYLEVGSIVSNLSSPNQNMPDTTLPNHVLAPFWADLINGTWFYALVQVGGETGPVYYIFEWKDAELKGDPSSQFSFQVWIERGTENIWFVYGPQTTLMTTGTVGAENRYGSVGFSYFYNGVGSAPVDGTTLKVRSILDVAEMTYALRAGQEKGTNIVNLARAQNQITNQVLEAGVTVYVGDSVYLPLVLRESLNP